MSKRKVGGYTYDNKTGRWVFDSKEKAFDYETLDGDSGALLVSFFRWYPDYFADMCRSPRASYKLQLAQRIMMRVFARYKDVYITGCRGLTKTYTLLLTKMIEGIFFPGEIMRYAAPAYKQAAVLASQAFAQIRNDYPLIAEHWELKNDGKDLFRIVTPYGSQFTMYAPRGDNSSQVAAEEIGQEGKDAFKMEDYERNILPTCRLQRMVNQKPDRVHINYKNDHISNACTRTNRAFSVHRNDCLKSMVTSEAYKGFVLDMPWEVALLSNLRDIDYIESQRTSLSPQDFLREMCAVYTGNEENPLLTDEVVSKSRRLMVMEDKHCGDPNAIYIVSHDVSFVDSNKNAKCADIVLKLTPFRSESKRGKYRKQVVYADNYAPPKTAYEQAVRLKELWRKYCLNGGNPTYLVIDAQSFGASVVQELMAPPKDGTLPLGSYDPTRFAEMAQPNALPVLYPLKATTRGGKDEDGEMILYAQMEFEMGNVELLTSSILDGIDAYKKHNKIKDPRSDGKIKHPYDVTELLCEQIANLKREVSGFTVKEKRKSNAIQRDIWSALKYALRMAEILEGELAKSLHKAKSTWADVIAAGVPTVNNANSGRNRILSFRRGIR